MAINPMNYNFAPPVDYMGTALKNIANAYQMFSQGKNSQSEAAFRNAQVPFAGGLMQSETGLNQANTYAAPRHADAEYLSSVAQAYNNLLQKQITAQANHQDSPEIDAQMKYLAHQMMTGLGGVPQGAPQDTPGNPNAQQNSLNLPQSNTQIATLANRFSGANGGVNPTVANGGVAPGPASMAIPAGVPGAPAGVSPGMGNPSNPLDIAPGLTAIQKFMGVNNDLQGPVQRLAAGFSPAYNASRQTTSDLAQADPLMKIEEKVNADQMERSLGEYQTSARMAPIVKDYINTLDKMDPKDFLPIVKDGVQKLSPNFQALQGKASSLNNLSMGFEGVPKGGFRLGELNLTGKEVPNPQDLMNAQYLKAYLLLQRMTQAKQNYIQQGAWLNQHHTLLGGGNNNSPYEPVSSYEFNPKDIYELGTKSPRMLKAISKNFTPQQNQQLLAYDKQLRMQQAAGGRNGQ